MSFTPNTQYIANAVEAEFGDRVRVGAWACRRIAGTLTWSQHAYTQENYLDRDYLGNACDIFPTSMAVGDQVQAFLWREFPDVVKVVLWRVKNHFDHVHFDPWPTGINLPPCRGGILQVRHKNGSIGREFTNAFDSQPAPIPTPDPAPVPVPLPPQTSEDFLLPITKASARQDIARVQDLINEAYYPPGEGIRTDGRYGEGMEGTVKKWLLRYTNDPNPEVVAGREINWNEYNALMKDWVLKIVGNQ